MHGGRCLVFMFFFDADGILLLLFGNGQVNEAVLVAKESVVKTTIISRNIVMASLV